jgi:hypothetical protein
VDTTSITGPYSPAVTRHDRSSAVRELPPCADATIAVNPTRAAIRRARRQNKSEFLEVKGNWHESSTSWKRNKAGRLGRQVTGLGFQVLGSGLTQGVKARDGLGRDFLRVLCGLKVDGVGQTGQEIPNDRVGLQPDS